MDNKNIPNLQAWCLDLELHEKKIPDLQEKLNNKLICTCDGHNNYVNYLDSHWAGLKFHKPRSHNRTKM